MRHEGQGCPHHGRGQRHRQGDRLRVRPRGRQDRDRRPQSRRRPGGRRRARGGRPQGGRRRHGRHRRSRRRGRGRPGPPSSWAASTCWSATPASSHIDPITDLAFKDWKLLLAIHLDGAFLTTRACLKQMKVQGRGGSVIYMGSVHSKVASPLKAPYVTAKHGLIGLAKLVAVEGAEYGVRANVICPGFVRTPLVDKQIPEQAKDLGISEEAVIKDVMLKETVDGEFTTVQDRRRDGNLPRFLPVERADRPIGRRQPRLVHGVEARHGGLGHGLRDRRRRPAGRAGTWPRHDPGHVGLAVAGAHGALPRAALRPARPRRERQAAGTATSSIASPISWPRFWTPPRCRKPPSSASLSAA